MNSFNLLTMSLVLLDSIILKVFLFTPSKKKVSLLCSFLKSITFLVLRGMTFSGESRILVLVSVLCMSTVLSSPLGFSNVSPFVSSECFYSLILL